MPTDPLKDALNKAESNMKEAIEASKREFSAIRTGRANPAILDRVMVEYYGDMVPVKHVATISAPEPRLLVIKPFDRATTAAIKKALLASDLGLNPLAESDIIRIPLPTLTEERRRELVKEVHKKTEEGKVEIRNYRREGLDGIRKLEKSHQISEDDLRRFQDDIQKLTDNYIKSLDDVAKKKSDELMET